MPFPLAIAFEEAKDLFPLSREWIPRESGRCSRQPAGTVLALSWP